MTGNKKRDTIVSTDQILLYICVLIWPCVTQDNTTAFIHNKGRSIYSNCVILARMKELKIIQKRVSIETNQTFLPQNLQKKILFWSVPSSVGIVGIR